MTDPPIVDDEAATLGPGESDPARRSPELRPTIPRYRLGRELGSGGMGTVFLAHRQDDEYEQRVAIKVLHRVGAPEVLDRFRAERQILADLEHPDIVRILDGGTTAEGSPFYVMEHVEGEPITRHCERHRLPLEARLRLFLRVLDAVQVAHQSLIVHRDLKPENILVTPRGELRLLDFGIAKVLDASDFGQSVAETRAGTSPMTPEYASPEQMMARPVTTATDVYALGVLLCELLTGELPYRGRPKSLPALAQIIVHEDPVAPSALRSGRRRVPADVDAIVLKALEKEPAERYPSAAAMAADIRRFLAGEPVLARQGGAAYRWRKFVRRHRLGVSLAALAVAALVAFSSILAVQNRHIVKERDRALREVAKSRAGKIESLNQLGELMLAAGRGEEARMVFQRALEMAGDDEETNRRSRFLALVGLARVETARGRAAPGADLFARGFAELGEAFRPSDPEVAVARSDYGGALLELGELEGAGRQLRTALDVLSAGGDVDHRRQTLERLARLAELEGDAEAATGYRRRAAALAAPGS